MAGSQFVMSTGACCFGLAIGYITYRTLARSEKAAVTDLTTVVGAVGGAAVTGLFDPQQGDAFGWYAIGLLAGMILFFLLFWKLNGTKTTASIMGGKTIGPSSTTESRARDSAASEHIQR
ncbi:hypothetical protein [Streptomyces sp. MBT62]|uniref:hypothetical protein n=1 Tax=Streptomyces sp. MBT62 TaxID=2800410 RepID=UPI00190A1371|nr:hypothetical protein [Streptomyces sp. MBT62]MBK3562678.1 hypothetical protein [Streptomyces sp. MBT62]